MCSTEKHQVTFILSSEVLQQEPTEAELSDSASGHPPAKKPERTKRHTIVSTISIARQIHLPYNCLTFH